LKAIAIDAFGGIERLRLVTLLDPRPAPGEVLIAVEYAGVNPVDWKVREGMLADMLPHRFPIVPGWDAAGTIRAVGEGVADFAPGDRVYAYCRKPEVHLGTYAELVAVPAAVTARIPDNLSFASAATIPLAGLTAWQSLFDTAHLTAGEKVLIHAGAGGVGSLAIQFAKHAGATVFTTSSRKNHDYVRGLGADAAIDYREESFVDRVKALAPEGIDVVFDTIGGEVQGNSYRVLKPGGRLVSVISIPDAGAAGRPDVKADFVFVSPDGNQLREISTLLEGGAIQPPSYKLMKLEEAAKAQELSRAGHVRGKIILKVR
jgi:NADPH2:quinone reductase